MSKIIDTTYIEDSEYLLSQTPPNFVENNYHLKELQEKINVDWKFRPNRMWIEQELEPGTEEYTPIDAVIQHVYGEAGERVSNDWYNLVFRDCSQHNRMGKRYRFSWKFDPNEPDEEKNVWIGLNQNNLQFTSSQTVCRCNGTIASIYTDETGKNILHYEPVVQPTRMITVNFEFDKVAVDPRGQLNLIAQHNKYTEQYYINQRFIIGYDKVYKVNNIIKADSQTTYNPKDVGIIRIYLDEDQIGDLDNFENRLAYNGIKDEPVVPAESGKYSLVISEPSNIPEFLTPDGIVFRPQVLLGDIPQSVDVNVSCELGGAYKDLASFSDYCAFENNGDGTFTLKRIKENSGLSVVVTCRSTPESEEIELRFELQLRDF